MCKDGVVPCSGSRFWVLVFGNKLEIFRREHREHTGTNSFSGFGNGNTGTNSFFDPQCSRNLTPSFYFIRIPFHIFFFFFIFLLEGEEIRSSIEDRTRREPTQSERTGITRTVWGLYPLNLHRGIESWPPSLIIVTPPVEVYPYPIARVALAPARHSLIRPLPR